VYKYGLQGGDTRWVNEHWGDARYFPCVDRDRPVNFDRTLRRWLKGQKIPQSEKDEVLLQDLWERHGVPQYIAGKMLDAAKDQPSQCRDFTFEERVALWQLRRTGDEEDIDVCGETGVRCNLLVFGARTVDDFSSKVYKLFERSSPRDGVEWVMFDHELRKIVGLILP
jgi:hypothetical protein